MKITTVIPRKQPGLRERSAAIIVASLLFGLLFMPVISSAVTLSGDSATYIQSREAIDRTKILGGYEYLDLAVQDLGTESISFHTGGWLRYDLKGEELGKKTNNDLQYSYLSFKQSTGNTIVNLGRVMVFEGVSAERVDGAYARTDLKGGFGISAYGGAPVETLESTTGGIYGGRLSHQVEGVYKIGISYLKEKKSGIEFREQEGVDLWFHPIDKVDLVGRSTYNFVTRGLMEHSYNLVLGPFAGLRFTTEAAKIDYKDYFQGSTISVFTFSPEGLDPNEKVKRLGEEVSYAVTDRITLAADVRSYNYDLAGDAKSFGGSLRYAVPAAGGAGLSFRKMHGDTSRLQYTEYRAYANKKIDKTDITLDLLDVKYEVPINGVSNAYSATAAAQYELARNLKIGADVEYAKNPDFDREIRVFAKVLYSFDTGPAARTATAEPAQTPAAAPAEKPAAVQPMEPAQPAAVSAPAEKPAAVQPAEPVQPPAVTTPAGEGQGNGAQPAPAAAKEGNE